MRCDAARRAVSERLDGEHARRSHAAALDDHLTGCAACRAFEARAWRLRESSRIGLAPVVPDLVDPIMDRVEAEFRASRRSPSGVLRRARGRVPRTRRLAPLAAALAVGVLAGSLTVGGPWHGASRGPGIAAADISRGIAQAAPRLNSYHAVFAMTEHDPRREQPVRTLTMTVWFRAPERFRLDVGDPTGSNGASDDLRFVVNGDESYTRSPSPCPVAPCPPREDVVRGRTPFSGGAPVTDLIMPVATLVDAEGVQVLGRETFLGRPAIRVEVPFERARPLFPFLSIGGSWRPFFPDDHVELLLDARDWFPLRYTVYPAGSDARDGWEMRFGLTDELARDAVFDVVAVEIDRSPPAASAFRIPDVADARDEGARRIPLDRLASETELRPAPALGGLDLYRITAPQYGTGGDRRTPTTVTYTSGLSWLKLGETLPSERGSLFEGVASHAEEVSLPNGGVGYYEPATEAHGRRLTLHTTAGDLAVETNLPRADLLDAAASLPVTGLRAPRGWLVRRSAGAVSERVPLDQAITRAPFDVRLPTHVPAGYVVASAELVRIDDAVGVNVYFERRDAAFGTGPIRLHEEAGDELPPASSARQDLVRVGTTVIGRWTPERFRLEWIDRGVYHSLDAEGASLGELLTIAESLDGASEDAG